MLAGCQPAAPPLTEPPPESASGVRAGLRWDAAVSGAAMALVLYDVQGAPLLRLACVRDPPAMTVRAERFRAIASEERLSFGVDAEPFVFVADPTAPRPVGVEARAPISEDLLRRLETAREISVSYGAQTLGPHMPPDPDSARRFAAACRQIAGLR